MTLMRILVMCTVLVVGRGSPALAADPPKPGSGIHYLYLIRHGAYDRDSLSDDDVAFNGLNTLGHAQAVLVGKRIAGLGVRPASLVSSNYKRARETAADMAPVLELPVSEDSLLHECTPPTDRADYSRNHDPAEIALCDSNLTLAWAKYMTATPQADRIDVLVCHGNVIRRLVTRAIGADTRRWWALEIANGSLTVIAVRPDGTSRLVLFSDVGHLPIDQQTWTGKGGGWSIARSR